MKFVHQEYINLIYSREECELCTQKREELVELGYETTTSQEPTEQHKGFVLLKKKITEEISNDQTS